MAQPLVRQLVDADLGIGASIRHLKANDLPGRGVRSQRCGSIHVETPLPHSKQIHTAHVGEARTESPQAHKQPTQVVFGTLQDDVDREITAGRG